MEGRPVFRLLRLRDSAWFAQAFPVTVPLAANYPINRGRCQCDALARSVNTAGAVLTDLGI